MPTNIEWCEETWSPVTGCSPVSAGCDHCYAKRMANRLRGRYGYPKDDPFKVTLHPERVDEFVEPPRNHPYRWRKPRMIFVPSMGDLFHKDVPFDFIERVWATMMEADHHIYVILTKRPERMLEAAKYFCWTEVPHVWHGVSVEDQKTADERIPELLKVPAAVRIVSIEPMLGEIDLCHERHWLPQMIPGTKTKLFSYRYSYSPAIDWVIVGGETGPGARIMKRDWVYKVRDDCEAAGVPFFFKSWSHFATRKPGRLLDGKEWNERPEV